MSGRWALLESLRAELEATNRLIAERQVPAEETLPQNLAALYGSKSLLEICADIVVQARQSLEQPFRTLHHFACTGGTLFAKVVASQPDVHLLSEVHPHSPMTSAGKAFAPSDISLLSRAGGLPDIDDLVRKLFSDSIVTAHEWVAKRGGKLVLRDHAHSDFCMLKPPSGSALLSALSDTEYPVLPVVTVRHPADSFCATKQHGWFRDAKKAEYSIDFETYCQRYLDFLDAIDPVATVKYEALVEDPDATMRELCRVWGLEFDELSLDIFSQFQFSGDSGRTGTSIAPRDSRPESLDYRRSTGDNYVALASRLGYSIG